MQQRADAKPTVTSEMTTETPEAAPPSHSGEKSAREIELDAKIRFYTRIFIAMVLVSGAFKAYALLAPKYLN